MIQMIIVSVIGVILLVYLVYKMYRIFFNKEYTHICHHCPESRDCNKAKVIRDGCHKNGRPE